MMLQGKKGFECSFMVFQVVLLQLMVFVPLLGVRHGTVQENKNNLLKNNNNRYITRSTQTIRHSSEILTRYEYKSTKNLQH